jgi:anti-sigma factor RsiW
VAKKKSKKQADYSCQAATSLIGEYLAGSLEPGHHSALEEHFGRCPDCAAFLRTYKKTIDATRAFLRLQGIKSGSHRLKFPRRQQQSFTALIF